MNQPAESFPGNRDAIAVVGLACRLPGADGPAEFWRLLSEGRDAVTTVPADRWDAGEFDHPGQGGFLDRVDLFDPGFFGIAPREAAAMDPQQRLVLELGWESLEHAGIRPGALVGSRSGVFLGAAAEDYAVLARRGGVDAITRSTLTGTHRSLIANRLSYLLGLRGPSLVLDTGQSSALVAVHTAVRSLRSGECDLALAGGVHLMLAPESAVSTAKFGALSPDGRCFTFDERANGYVRGEGGGVVVLKRLADALADGDRVRGLILGSAVNNDGGGAGLTVPDPVAQAEVLRLAGQDAGVRAAEVQYVELHGTGTRQGDPAEAGALGAALGTAPERTTPLAVGSVKTNIGHLEGAAGIAGLLKALLCLENRQLPPSLNFANPNPALRLAEHNLRVQTELGPWPRPDRPLIAGVSSFGMGGTNAHVVLAEAPPTEPAPASPSIEAPLLLSARTEAALHAQAEQVRALLATGADRVAVARALAGRTEFEHRAAAVGDPDQALAALVPQTATTPATVAFMFSGQGSQWPGMGADLLTYPVFAETFTRLCDKFGLDLPLSEAVHDTANTQPALFALEVALYRLLESLGITPSVLIGHSLGEITAAHIAGVLGEDDAVTLVAARARLMQSITAPGAMLAIQASEAEVLPLLTAGVSIAAVNTPTSVVVSGDADAVEALRDCGFRTTRLKVSHAFHSAHLDPILDEFAAVAAGLTYHEPQIPVVTNLTGDIATTLTDPQHWVRHVRGTVRFADGLATVANQGVTHLVEVGPHPALTPMAQEVSANWSVGGVMRRDQDVFLAGLGHLWATGLPVDWAILLPETTPIDLPAYPFQRERYWLDSIPAPTASPEPAAPADLLDTVRRQIAVVAGYRGPEQVDPHRTFKELGFESLTAVELCRNLSAVLGRQVPPSAVYDHPTPAELAEHLTGGAEVAVAAPVVAEEPIAIVGMACRLPGGADTPEKLWQLVLDGADVISEFPDNRGWDLEGTGGSSTRHGGFVPDADRFDAEFFGISPREAVAMDPQQRLVLEVAWESLERAGILPEELRGSRTGVFLGATAADYGPRLHEVGGAEGYGLTGSSPSVISGRLAYTLGLRGPALTIDTACSSSLVALHVAAESLRRGETDTALAGGVTVLATPGMFLEFSKQRGLSPDGRCKAFGAGADGTGWAEGAGVLVLQRLSDARRENRRVLAVLRGSAINQDGASNGLTAPNGTAQQQVIRAAVAAAGLSTADIDLIEAHGTGTVLGDPIEANALLATYGQDRDRPARLGSLKSNLGHTQAAAGVAGVIKVVQALRAGVLPPTLHAAEPSPHIAWDSGAVELVHRAEPWPETGKPRRAAVSSFGISGTNAHVVLESVPEPVIAEVTGPETVALLVSGRTAPALRAQAEALRAELAGGAGLVPVARALAATRTSFEHRAAVIVSTVDDALAGLDVLAAGGESPEVVTGEAAACGGPVFVFPGQGSQWAQMAVGLLDSAPVFA
ncbi:acyltransferase domain-containing protein, partial [Crossiella sp. SN42]|uniref:type I polyketide synthase n=1 Tax=Crossiella sp. SN42 TaxID=2944808 RepID=UPI00207D2BC4